MSGSQQLLLGEGAGGSGPPVYIEEVFSTYLYTGTGSAQTITNGIDFSTKGGLLWFKARNDTRNHWLYDTTRSIANGLRSDSTAAATSTPDALTAFNTNGFSIGTSGNINTSSNTLVSWSFRKQPKFFDVVTYTGTGSTQNIAHNLGAVPGCIIVKCTDGAVGWPVYHRSLGGSDKWLILNGDNATITSANYFGTPTSTFFPVVTDNGTNGAGLTYVAYLFAHDAGGFGLTGTDNVISCGSWTGTGSTFNVNLGYEPQWLMFKRTDDAGDWIIIDNMRGFTTTGADAYLRPNTSGAESNITGGAAPNSTGFSWATGVGSTFIYIAIRRGPMAVPTVGTSVFSPQVQTPPGGNSIMAASSGFPIDWLPTKQKNAVSDWFQTSRLTNGYMNPNTTAAENGFAYGFDLMQGVSAPWNTNTTVSYSFRRAPSFFDVVGYTGTGSATTVTHNLTVAPELMFVKARSTTGPWNTYVAPLGPTIALYLETTGSVDVTGRWNSTNPTSTVFSVSSNADVNGSGTTYVAYLFATCAGVSKVGSYTGTGATQTINCGFTTGARFVLIKITNTTGNWYVYDTARGMTVGTNPSLFFNSTSAEDPGSNISTTSVGFTLAASPYYPVNSNGFNYIFLAIA